MVTLEDDDEDILPVPVNHRLRCWLAEQARATGRAPGRIVARILGDIIDDDERAHRAH